MIKRVLAIVCAAVLVATGILLAASSLSVPSGTWSAAGPMNSARSGASTVLLQDGRILVTGGNDANGPSRTAEFFGANGSFSLAPPMNVPRSGHVAVVLQDGRVLVAGGTTSGGAVTNTAEIYDPAASTWTDVTGGMVEARSGHTAAVLQDGRVLIAGGANGTLISSTIEIFNPSLDRFAAAGMMSSARTQHAMAVLANGNVLIVGGNNGTAPVGSTDIFSPIEGTVSAGPKLSVARFGHSATTLLNGQVVVIGGNNGKANPAQMDVTPSEMFDPASATPVFTSLANNLATPREGHLAFLLPNNNNVLIVGGTSGRTTVASAELFTSQESTQGVWTHVFKATGSMSAARSSTTGTPNQVSAPSSVMQRNGVLLIAGGKDANGNTLNSSETYGFPTVQTDRGDYPPGTTVIIVGSGWRPSETVQLQLVESPLIDTHGPYTVRADANGNIFDRSFTTDAHDLDVKFTLTAVGSVSQAQMTFTDAFTNIRVKAGTVYTDSQGNKWSPASSSCSGGSSGSTSHAVTGALPAATDDPLYQSEQQGQSNCSFPAPAGTYAITFKWMEFDFSAANQRKFSVAINGTNVLTNFDIYAAAGGEWIAIDRTFNVTTTGVPITIAFLNGTPKLSRPKYDAIQITSASQLPAPTVSGVNPTSATQGQSLDVVIAGSNFQSGASCSFGGAGITVNSCVFNAAAQLTANLTIASTATLSARTVTVTNPDTQSASLAGAFTVSQAFNITGSVNDDVTGTGLSGVTLNLYRSNASSCTSPSPWSPASTATVSGGTYTATGTSNINTLCVLLTAPANFTASGAVAGTGSSVVNNSEISTPDGSTGGSSPGNNFFVHKTGAVETIVASNVSATYSAGAQNAPLTAMVTSTDGTVNTGSVTFTIQDGATTIGTATSGNVTSGSASVNYGLPARTTAKPYTIQATYKTGSGASDVTDGSHQLTVNQASLIITANNRTKTYGQAVTFAGTEFTTIGLVSPDTVTSATLTSTGAPATATVVGSPYSIVPSAAVGTGLANYTISYVNGTLTITTISPTVTVTGGTFTYDGNPHPATATAVGVDGHTAVSGSFGFTYTPPGNSTAPINAGTYSVTASFISSDPNYRNATGSGSITITTLASLTYTASPVSRTYGAANPPFTGNVTGFTGSDTQANSTTGTLTFTTPATSTSAVGSYAINGSGLAANNGKYAFVQAAANITALTVTKATPTVTVTGGTFTYDGNPHPATATAVGVDGHTAVSGSFGFTYTPPGNSTAPINAGTYSVTASFTSSDPNYRNATGSGSIAITTSASTNVSSNGTNQIAAAFGASSLSVPMNVTAGGSNTVAFATVWVDEASGPPGTTFTVTASYGGQVMSSAGPTSYDYNYSPMSSQVFYLANPPTGTNTLIVNATASSGTIQEVVANLISYNGVNQATPVRPGTYQVLHSAAGVTVGSFTATITSNTNDLTLGAVEATYTFASPASNQTIDATAAADYKVGSDHATTAAASVADTWNFTNPWAYYAYVGFSIQAASGGAPDFAISATPGSMTLAPGGSAMYTVNIGAQNGFSGAVTLGAIGLPVGTSASFVPATVSGSGSSTLTVTTSTDTLLAASALTITGSSGLLTHSASVSLVVSRGTPSVYQFQFNDNSNVASSPFPKTTQVNDMFLAYGSTQLNMASFTGVPTFSDGTAMTQCAPALCNFTTSNGSMNTSLWTGTSAGGTRPTFTMNLNAPGQTIGGFALEITGANQLNAIASSEHLLDSNTTLTSPSITTTLPNQLVLCLASEADPIAAGAHFTGINSPWTGIAFGNQAIGYMVAPAVGTYSCTMTRAAGTEDLVITIASFL